MSQKESGQALLASLGRRVWRYLTTRGPFVLSSLDSPSEPHVIVEGSCALKGWACAPLGIDFVEILVDGQRLRQIRPDGRRPDVAAAFPAIASAMQSGFDLVVDLGHLLEGSHALEVRVRDAAGHEVSHFRTLRVNASPYHALLLAKQLTPLEREARLALLGGTTKRFSFDLIIDARAEGDLVATVRSITQQTYPHWVCRIVSNAPPEIPPLAGAMSERISWSRSMSNASIAADGRGTGFVAFLVPGELLMPDALLHIASTCSTTDSAIVYSDHDHVDATGLRRDPEHAPDWSPERLLSRDYVGGVFFTRSADLAAQEFGMETPTWRYELLLALTDVKKDVVHVPRVLWSSPLRASAPADEIRAVEGALRRRGVSAEVSPGRRGDRRVQRRLSHEPRVSIIVPTTGRVDLVRPLVDSNRRLTAYKNYEFLFIDNGHPADPEGIALLQDQGFRVLRSAGPFNWSRLGNEGAGETDGDLILFLNDDIEIKDPNWLSELVSLALVPDVGSVGALLLYPDGLIQHAGIFLVDHGGGARHYLQFMKPEESEAVLTREVTANTGACLMVRRAVFNEIGGFNQSFQIAFGDVDFCLRLTEAGYRNLWTPQSVLVHHEGASREGLKTTTDDELAWTRWGHVLKAGDRFHNANLAKDRVDLAVDESVFSDAPPVALTSPKGPGVNLIGYIRSEMGLGEAARGLARAMDRSNIPFTIIDYEHDNPARKADSTWVHRIGDRAAHDINVFCVTAELIPEVMRMAGPGVTAGRYNIGYWSWELPDFPERWRSRFSLVDEVWVPSEFVRASMSGQARAPVTLVPFSVEDKVGPYFLRPYFGLAPHAFLFLAMYDTHSVRERKNPEGAIRAFQSAFGATASHVGLVVKVNSSQIGEEERLADVIGDSQNIRVIDRVLSRYEMDSLFSCVNAFVSLHRSEGFGLPLAEAMAFGKPVITTPWSGNTDFTDASCSASVSFQLRRLERTIPPYDQGQSWAEPDLAEAGQWMQRLLEDPALASRLGEAGRRRVRTHLSDQVVGETVRQRLAQIGAARNSR